MRDSRDGGRVPRVLLQRLGAVVDADSEDMDAAAATLKRTGISGVVAFNDDHLRFTAEIADRLGLPGYPPEVARTVRNKYLQRRAFQEAGLPQPRFWHLPAGLTAAELRVIGSTINYPAIVKPTEGAGSREVIRVDQPGELADAYSDSVDQLVEEFLAGEDAGSTPYSRLVSVDSVVTPAGISHIVIQGAFPRDDHRATGRFVPACVSGPEARLVLEVVSQAITTLGIRQSMVNTDIMMTDGGPQIIEVNGRLGGSTPGFLPLVSGLDLRRVALEVALGHPVRFPELAPLQGVGFSWDLNAPRNATAVAAVRGTETLAAQPFVHSVRVQVQPGEALDPQRGTFGVVSILGHTADHRELLKAGRLIQSAIAIEYKRDA
ncbi:MAG: ATP-grasp domain-containing protein [Solirubrobacteraceae bacterium]